MKNLFYKKSLKIVTENNENDIRIENVDSVLVSRLNSTLSSFCSGKLIMQTIRTQEQFIPIFRGFSPLKLTSEREKANYFKNFFIVGEKGKAYRENVLIDGIGSYYENEPNKDNALEILTFVNKRLKEFKFGEIKIEELTELFDGDIKNVTFFY